MADYFISHDKLIAALCDGCELKGFDGKCHATWVPCRERNRIDFIPTADVVEVVRCGECANADRSETPALWCKGRGFPMQMVPPDGFCDKGKRACDER